MRQKTFRVLKWCFLMCSLTTVLIMLHNDSNRQIVFQEYNFQNSGPLPKPTETWRNFSEQQKKKLSQLGRIMFLDEIPPQPKNKRYTILIWKYGSTLERRHMKHFSNQMFDPFEDCSVKNCHITYEDNEIKKADAVLFHLQRIKGVNDLPDESQRLRTQRWIFLTDETPFHTFLYKANLKDFNGIFNWSMTYRMDSDVPVPYGRTLLKNDLSYDIGDSFIKRTDVLVTIMGSNCGSKNQRWQYVKELQKHIDVDVYGNCGTLK